MVQLSLQLSDGASQFIQEQLATGKFATPDDVVSRTLEEAQLAVGKKRLAELIRCGLESAGTDIEFTEDGFDRRMDDIRAEFERRRSA